MAFWNWSKTAASNAGADPTINWAEGQAPSSVNDSARALMASAAMWRDDISGATVTTGSASAYSLSTFSNFTSSAALTGQMVAFTPHVTNTAIVTMTVDSVANIPLRTSPGKELLAGTIIQGTPYVATLASDGVLYLQGFYGNPYNVPLAAGMDYWAATTPNSSFAFPVGQAISRTTYATLYALVGTTYGAGDGSTTFNIPDKNGRVSVAADNGAGRILGGAFNRATLGGVGGEDTHTLTIIEMPSHSHPSTLTDPGHSHATTIPAPGGGAAYPDAASGSGTSAVENGPNTGAATTGITINNAAQGGGGAHNIVQPSIVCNYIIRII